MHEPLTYPPEIAIESTVDLGPEFRSAGPNAEAYGELLGILIEGVIELVIMLLVGGA